MQEIENNYGAGNYIKKRLEESEVISLIIEKAKYQYGFLDFFNEVTNIPRTSTIKFDKYYITKEILRTELGLKENQKPGDIDILIIPAYKTTVYFEYTSVFEVKVVRPTNKNFRRNSNSLGTTQTHGLIQDGFPLVGLIHVCMNEPINPVYLQHIPNIEDTNVFLIFDPFPFYTIETQYKRVLKTNLPKYVGINIFGLNFRKDGKIAILYSENFREFKYGYFNPYANSLIVEIIKVHFESYRNKYIEKT